MDDGRLSLKFNLTILNHEIAKNIIDTLPRGVKSNFIAEAVVAYWNSQGGIIDIRKYKTKSERKNDNNIPNAVETTNTIINATNQNENKSPSSIVIETNQVYYEEDLELSELLKNGLNSFF